MEKNINAKEKSFLESMFDLDKITSKLDITEVQKYKEKYGCDPCDACGSASCSDCKACAENDSHAYSNLFKKKYN